MPSAPEELRFDFAPGEGELDDASARALQSRVREVHDVAARRTRRSASPFSTSEPVDWRDEERDTAEEPSGDEEVEGGVDPSLSIAEFYERVKRALRNEFEGEFWVTGEIRGLRASRGHHYLELADEGSDPDIRVSQQLEVVCWSRDWPNVAAALAEAGVDLEVGRVVRVRGRVSVWEGGSKLRFTLTALDVEALVGGIAAARRRLLMALEREGLLEANRRLPVPLVPMRIGLVTSNGTEGHRDFVGQLERSGLAFVVQLESSLVQGPEAPAQLAAALKRLEAFAPDLAVIVRGGGARADLAAFDAEVVARAIASAPFPIWCGIGHSGDRSVVDELVQRSCITPTEAGKAVVETVASYLEDVDRKARRLASVVRARLVAAEHASLSHRRELAGAVHHQLDRRAVTVANGAERLARSAHGLLAARATTLAHDRRGLKGALRRLLEQEEARATHRAQVLRAYDPARQLERGWALSFDEQGHLVRSVASLGAGMVISTRYADGRAESVVQSIKVDKVEEPRP